MTINTQLRLTILASALALVVAAPVAIAQDSGTWYGDMHTDTSSADGVITRHSRALMEKKIPAAAAIAQEPGTWYGNMHTDTSSADGVITRHSRKLMGQQVVPSNPTETLVQLTDGSTVHIFADGKMAMESRFGRATFMEPGHVMQTTDGKIITMNGNEVARLNSLIISNSVGG